MNGYELIASVVNAVAWPAVVLAAVFIWKNPIAKLIGRFRKIDFRGGTVDFLELVEEAGQQLVEPKGQESKPSQLQTSTSTGSVAPESSAPKPTPERAMNAPGDEIVAEAARLLVPSEADVDANPTGSVLRAWNAVEAAIGGLYDRTFMPESELLAATYKVHSSLTTHARIRKLKDRGRMPDGTAAAIERLQQARNMLVHSRSGEMSPVASREYVRVAYRVVDLINRG